MQCNMKTAVFGAGCFWGVQLAFDELTGVKKTRVGYMGGITENPTYNEVCQGISGHIEVVEINYDETQISYEDLLAVFWKVHNPTQVDRQGVDVGIQYRSVIFYTSESQKHLAEQSIQDLENSDQYCEKIATKIQLASRFYEAEEYHQNYLAKKGKASCKLP